MFKQLIAIVFILIIGLPNFALAQTKQKISLLLFNGKVFSADEKFSTYEAVAVDGEKIVAVGKTADLKAKYSATKEIDLQGKLVTPGFNDAHIHFAGVGMALLQVDLNGSNTLDEAKRRIAAKVKETPKGQWIVGRGWDHTLWNNRLPTRADLDDIAPENPVFLQRVDGHIAWANSKAFELAKITKSTPNPEGGEIVRDANGEAAGVVKETAQGLIDSVIPPPSPEMVYKGLLFALDEAKKFGLTSVQGGEDAAAMPIYAKLLQENKLSARVAIWQDFEKSVADLKKERADFDALKLDHSRLKFSMLKGYLDGSLGSRTAAMLAPYSDDPNNSGIPRRPAEEMIKMIVERDAAGFQIGLHAIGDKSNRIALDGFAFHKELIPTVNNFDSTKITAMKRHRIEHAQVVAPSDFKRFAELGVIASMQPTHAISDKRWAGERLGEYRVLGAYSWHLFESYNVHVAFGTDAPVELLNTYQTLYAAVSRQDLEGNPAGGWQPQEKLPMTQAIRNYTYESAYAEFAEKEKGTIAVGMFADLVVHSKDLLTIPHKEILTTEPVYTIFNGKIIYEKK
ncbi:MAG TPA: amidohydrolase [Pyrinomonadaceae bacterium]|nr:amidohydrolase [Pyrinomonadaceae bacterium]